MSFINNFIPVLHKEDRKLLGLPDCIHLLEYGRCDILSVSSCRGEKCSFNQSVSSAHSSYENWKQHINSLDMKTQKEIARKYYRGAMPWRE